MKKVGNTSFHEETIKKMTLKQFKGTYDSILGEDNTEEIYYKVTGKSAKKEKSE